MSLLSYLTQAFGLHDHGAKGDGHAHEEEEEGRNILWRSLVVVLGLYVFFLFEFVLHSWSTHSHTLSIGKERLSSAEVISAMLNRHSCVDVCVCVCGGGGGGGVETTDVENFNISFLPVLVARAICRIMCFKGTFPE